jgi:hypothetical protein
MAWRAPLGTVGLGLVILCPVLRFETFGSGLEASNAAREDDAGLRARFAGRGGLGDSPRVLFEPRVEGIAPNLGMNFLRFLISGG